MYGISYLFTQKMCNVLFEGIREQSSFEMPLLNGVVRCIKWQYYIKITFIKL